MLSSKNPRNSPVLIVDHLTTNCATFIFLSVMFRVVIDESRILMKDLLEEIKRSSLGATGSSLRLLPNLTVQIVSSIILDGKALC